MMPNLSMHPVSFQIESREKTIWSLHIGGSIHSLFCAFKFFYNHVNSFSLAWDHITSLCKTTLHTEKKKCSVKETSLPLLVCLPHIYWCDWGIWLAWEGFFHSGEIGVGLLCPNIFPLPLLGWIARKMERFCSHIILMENQI